MGWMKMMPTTVTEEVLIQEVFWAAFRAAGGPRGVALLATDPRALERTYYLSPQAAELAAPLFRLFDVVESERPDEDSVEVEAGHADAKAMLFRNSNGK